MEREGCGLAAIKRKVRKGNRKEGKEREWERRKEDQYL